MMAIAKDGSTFSNWAGNQIAAPVRIDRPCSEQQLVAAVTDAAERGWTVKAVGAGHSFTDIALTSGLLLDLAGYAQVLKVDRNLVTVQAGIRLHDLAKSLADHDLALPNLGDIDAQSIAGAISTGTHGTGLGFQGVASCVVGMRVVTGEGEAVDLTEDQLRVGRVGLGAAGLISTVTLECVPAFWLRAQEDRRTVDEMLESFDSWSEEYDHAEFFWMPHTDKVLTKRNTRLFEEPPPVSRAKRARGRLATELSENVAYGALCRLGSSRPELIPRLARAVVSGASEKSYVAPSWEVFATPRRVKFVEMEYAVPREVWANAFKEVQHLIDVIDEPVNFPVEVRVLGGDDISMSMANGRDSVFIAVHNYRGMAYERYFRGVESIMKRYDGRPHWGKLHYRTADELAQAYPDWDRFLAMCHQLDGPGTYRNPYLARVLG